ncbi:MAG: DUF6291 domain-containing protein [Ruthenibacterium lactatiformans]
MLCGKSYKAAYISAELKPTSRTLADTIKECTPSEHLHSWTYSNYFHWRITRWYFHEQAEATRNPERRKHPDYLNADEIERVRKAETAIMALLMSADYKQIRYTALQGTQSGIGGSLEMADIKEKHPTWFKMKIERRQLIKQLPAETAVNVLLACWDYLETGEIPETLQPMEKIAFSAFFPDMEEAWTRYEQRVKNGASGGRPTGQ